MQLHPGKKIQIELKDRGWTQRQFAFLLWKKVSEVNELIKWKRNITVQRDILLSHVLWTSRKYRLDLQNEYEYSLIESDFDISKLPNIDQKLSSPIEQENKPEIVSEKTKETPQNIPLQEKKEEEQAPQVNDNLNKVHKIDKDVDISNQQKKHQNLSWSKSIKIDQNLSKEENTNKEWQEKKDKYDRQKIYNQNDKFDTYIPIKEKAINIQKHENKISDSSHKKQSSQSQEKKDDHKDHNKHKEHIFRNF